MAIPAMLGPAVAVAYHARTSDRVEHWLAWTLLAAFTSVVGLVAYWEHVVIRERRAEGNGEGSSDGSRP